MTNEDDTTSERPEAETGGTDGTAITGTFLVIEADDETAVVRDVDEARVHTLSENHDLVAGEVLEGTIAPEPPLELAWELVEHTDRRTIPVERGAEPPTTRSRDLAEKQAVGEVTRIERAGIGEIHVLTVAPEQTDAAVGDVLADEATRERAARLGVARVEIRAADGVLSVRYLP